MDFKEFDLTTDEGVRAFLDDPSGVTVARFTIGLTDGSTFNVTWCPTIEDRHLLRKGHLRPSVINLMSSLRSRAVKQDRLSQEVVRIGRELHALRSAAAYDLELLLQELAADGDETTNVSVNVFVDGKAVMDAVRATTRVREAV